ncbi:sugar phosphate isomerase/epimerase family protein [Desmospora activa]|uniref:Sugar phosphate isomerase/epimerase n=1 Tax=Desmospora activa DSM 45169 TaxID=1121389 RepID=A0A2T4Z7U3_9BACL|nr:sugar phosphate isomerase/epimerase family protein [Desmospora activa]PTM57966.1 sugar phosphate isomerase/epimerase [Desmospora activa DSM 45169]
MKLSVYSVMTPDLTPEELVSALTEYGYEGVEWRWKETPAEYKREKPSFWRNHHCSIDPAATDEEIEGLRRLIRRHGLSTIGVIPYLTTGEEKKTERVMQVAAMLGASQIRVGVPSYDDGTNYHDQFEHALAYLGTVEKLAQKYGVKGLVETHHQTIAPSAGLAYRLVSRFDPVYIGVIFDPGNMVHEGYEHYRMGLELLGPYLAHVHVKNAAWKSDSRRKDGTLTWSVSWSPLMDGIVDWKRVLDDLKAVGYNGYLSMEDFSEGRPSRQVLKQNAEYIRSLLEG